MIVTCKHCATRFKLNDERVKPSGVKVRCSNCQRVYRVYPAPAGPMAVDSPRAGEGRGSAAGFAMPPEAPMVGAGAALDARREAEAATSATDGHRDLRQADSGSPDDDFDLSATEFADIEKMLAVPVDAGPAAEPGDSTGEKPLTLDLSDLEIAPETDDTVDLDIDLDFAATPKREPRFNGLDATALDDGGLEVETVPPPSAREESAVADEPWPAASLEDAGIESELSDFDLDAFDLLSDDTEPADEMLSFQAVPMIDRDLEDLDPAEIEALLDVDGPLPPLEDENGDGAEGAEAPLHQTAGRGGETESPPRAAEFADQQGGKGSDEAFGGLEWDVDEDLLPPETPGESPAVAAGGGEDDLDITLLEKMMADDSDKMPNFSDDIGREQSADAEAMPPAAEAGATSDDFELSALDALLDQELAAEAAERPAASAGEQDDELGLDLDLGGELGAAESEAPEPAPANAVEPETGEALEDSFDLSQLEKALEEGAAGLAAEGDEHDFEPPAAEYAEDEEDFSAIETEDSLDFSDIEKLLEEEVNAPETEEEPEAGMELELDLNLSDEGLGPEMAVNPAEDAAQAAAVEKALAEVAAPARGAAAKPEGAGLELELEPIPEEFGGASVILEGTDGIELETLANYEDLETVAAEAIDRLNDGSPKPRAAVGDTFDEAADEGDELLPSEMSMVGGRAGRGRPGARRGVSTPLLVLLVLAVIGGGGYAAYTMLDWSKIEIPFIGQFFQKKAADMGDLYNIEPVNVKSRFVSNASSGILLVISGSAKNGYDHPRSYIQIKGTLKSQDGRPLKTLTVYCGNVISDAELETLDMAAIEKRLSRRGGLSRSNVKVPSGRSVPFMLVFSDLPADLGEFAVQAAGSVSAN